MRADRGVQVRARQAGEQGMGTKRGWVVAVGLALGLAGWLAGAGVPAAAAPARQGVSCEWRAIAKPVNLIPAGDLPGYGFFFLDNARLRAGATLDVTGYPNIRWNPVTVLGRSPNSTLVANYSIGTSGRAMASRRFELLVFPYLDGRASVGRMDLAPPAGNWCASLPRLSLRLETSPFVNLFFVPGTALILSVSQAPYYGQFETHYLDLAAPRLEWKSLATSGRAPPKSDKLYRVVLDPTGRRVFVLGGSSQTMTTPLVLDLSAGIASAKWIEITTGGSPPPLEQAWGSVEFVAYMKQLSGFVWTYGNSLRDNWLLDLGVTPPMWRRLAVTGDNMKIFGAGPFYHSDVAGITTAVGDFASMVIGNDGNSGKSLALLACRPIAGGGPLASTADQPDLAVGSPPRARGWLPGNSVTLPLTPCVRNLGSAPAPRFTVRADDGVTWTAPGLGAGQELCLEPKASRGRSVTVDPDNRVREADETNNARAVEGAAVPASGARAPAVVDWR